MSASGCEATGPTTPAKRSGACLRAADRLIADIEAQLLDLDHHVPTLLEIAEALGMSERTLRRRLRSCGTSYKEILREVRHRLAAAWLQETGLTVHGIACKLGYTETANFRHAFRRWVGCSPHAYRALREEDIGPQVQDHAA